MLLLKKIVEKLKIGVTMKIGCDKIIDQFCEDKEILFLTLKKDLIMNVDLK